MPKILFWQTIRMRKVLLTLAALFALGLEDARAGVAMTGNELHVIANDPASTMICYGYITGAWEGAMTFADARHVICGPGATKGQLMDVVRKWLVDHPETRNQPVPYLVAAAAFAAWPCQ
jgi:Rap1a immunity proteins